jgi:hypothetical protein
MDLEHKRKGVEMTTKKRSTGENESENEGEKKGQKASC